MHPKRNAVAAGVLAMAAVVAALAFDPTDTVELMRARVFDRILALAAPRLADDVAVIDIDEASVEALGPWPWPRERIARLIDAARAAGASAVGVDILFAAPETQSTAALARRLAAETGDAHVSELAASLSDDDARLAKSLAGGPVALGFALSPDAEGEAPAATPTLARGAVDLGAVWSDAGGVYPLPGLASNAAAATLSLRGDADGLVRRAPLFVAAAGVLQPGLALETLRLARGASAYLLEADPQRVVSGGLSAALPRDAMLRLAPLAADAPTVSAADALAGKVPPLKGAVAFIGVSAAEAGGLRATAGDPLTPSVMIEAQAARQILAGFAPLEWPPRLAWAIGVALGLGLIAAAALAAAPLAYGLATVAFVLPFAAALSLAGAARLIDPLEIAAPALAGFAAAAAVSGAAARRRARWLRARFERHLAPQVIARIVANEDAPKLSGEMREITALFTDIEGFTGMVGRSAPEALVSALDGYFDGVTRIALAHGGLMDKFVGDAAHVFFNMPFDLADHATHALDCAVEIARWSDAYRREPGPAALGFGRTRIGVESGPALVGDVGGGAKLDYTAHGETVNAAARLEQANKLTGSAILLGPGATARIARDRLRPAGVLELRGFPAPMPAATPWPEAATAEWRARYLAAFTLRESEPQAAARAFAELAGEIEDPVARALAGADKASAE